MSSAEVARRMWRLFEPVHAITYFAPECTEQFKAAGLKGFWMGYFAGRSAPMGAVEPAVVSATFYNFAPRMVTRAIPDAWGFAPPAAVLDARLAGVDRVLRRVLGDEVSSPEMVRAAELACDACEGTSMAGRTLAAANLDLDWPDEPALSMWQAATILREHRGDGHVALLVDAELDGCETHVSFVAAGAVTRDMLQPNRGWTDEEWAAAEQRLVERGWIDGRGQITGTGAEARRRIEADTDRLAFEPWDCLGTERTEELAGLLRPWVRQITEAGVLPTPNPIGLVPES